MADAAAAKMGVQCTWACETRLLCLVGEGQWHGVAHLCGALLHDWWQTWRLQVRSQAAGEGIMCTCHGPPDRSQGPFSLSLVVWQLMQGWVLLLQLRRWSQEAPETCHSSRNLNVSRPGGCGEGLASMTRVSSRGRPALGLGPSRLCQGSGWRAEMHCSQRDYVRLAQLVALGPMLRCGLPPSAGEVAGLQAPFSGWGVQLLSPLQVSAGLSSGQSQRPQGSEQGSFLLCQHLPNTDQPQLYCRTQPCRLLTALTPCSAPGRMQSLLQLSARCCSEPVGQILPSVTPV